MGVKRHALGTYSRMTRYPLYKRLGGPKDRSGKMRIISPPTGGNSKNVMVAIICAHLEAVIFFLQHILTGFARFSR